MQMQRMILGKDWVPGPFARSHHGLRNTLTTLLWTPGKDWAFLEVMQSQSLFSVDGRHWGVRKQVDPFLVTRISGEPELLSGRQLWSCGQSAVDVSK